MSSAAAQSISDATNNVVFYEAECPACHTLNAKDEKDFLKFAGELTKAAVDRHETPTLYVEDHETGKRIGIPKCECENCEYPELSARDFRRKEYDPGDLPAHALVQQLVEDEVDHHVETDPLMLALEKVKQNNSDHNPLHLETGTVRLTYYCRWLILPVQAFLRVAVFKNVDFEIIGGVSIFRVPGAAAGKKSAFAQGGWKSLWMKLFPLALAPDMPFFIFPFLLICSIWVLTQIFMRYCVYSSNNNEVQSSNNNNNNNNNLAHLETWVLRTSFLTFVCASSAIFFQAWTIIREPGYILPAYARPGGEEKNAINMINLPKESKSSLIESDPRFCRTCKIVRPPKAAHCRLCDCCVQVHDHHCIAISACIGARNVGQFCAFLFTAFSGSLISCIQIAFYMALVGERITPAGWGVGVLAFLLAAFSTLWTGQMGLQQLLNIANEETSRDRFKKDLKEAGVPSPTVGTELAGSSHQLGPTQKMYRFLFKRRVPPSQLAGEFDEGSRNVDEQHSVI